MGPMLFALIVTISMLVWGAHEAAGQAAGKWVGTNPGGGGAINSPVLTVPSGYWALGSDLSGVYLSKNKGESWRCVGAADGLTATHVASMAAHPAGKLLVGTDGGIFTAREDGTRMRRTYPMGYISALVVSPGNSTVVYAALHPQYNALSPVILRSNDAGESWAPVSSNLPADLRVVGLRAHQVDPKAVVVVSGKGRFNKGPKVALLSNDGGKTFTRIGQEVTGGVLDIVYGVDPTQLNRVYLTTYRNGDSGSLWRSEDAGWNWVKVANKSGVILVDATRPRRVRLLEAPFQHDDDRWEGDAMMWESGDGGASWTGYEPEKALTPGWSNSWKTWGMGSSFQGFVQTWGSSPAAPDTVLWTDSQFVFASSDGGRSWRQAYTRKVKANWITRGFDNLVPAVVAPSPANLNLVYAGHYDIGLWRSNDGGTSWVSLNVPKYSGGWKDAVGGNTLTVLPDPTRADVVWAQLGGDLKTQAYLVRSNNRGLSWVQLTQGLPTASTWIQGLSLDPSSPSTARWLFVVADGTVYRSTTDGTSWGQVLECPACELTRVIGGVVYAGGAGGLWQSSGGGAAGTWSSAGLPTSGWKGTRLLDDPWSFAGLTDITGDKEGRLWAAVYGVGFYCTTSAANSSWQLVRIDRWALSVAADARTGLVYTGSSSALRAGGYNPGSAGVMVWDGKSWKSMNAGLAWPFATQVRVVGGRLWALSPGQGLVKWR